MSGKLVGRVLDNAPRDLTQSERLVLAVLAEQARDQTRRCWPGMALLVRRTGLEPDSLRKVFQRLAARGLEVRVQAEKDGAPIFDRRGRPVFAFDGKQTNYLLPEHLDVEWQDDDPPTAADERRDARPSTWRDQEPSSGTQRWDDDPASGIEWRDGGPSVPGPSSASGGTTVPPIPSLTPQSPQQQPRATPLDADPLDALLQRLDELKAGWSERDIRSVYVRLLSLMPADPGAEAHAASYIEGLVGTARSLGVYVTAIPEDKLQAAVLAHARSGLRPGDAAPPRRGKCPTHHEDLRSDNRCRGCLADEKAGEAA